MPRQQRILLLNPPGAQLYLRDYYCSTISKAGYLWQPVDLLVQSGYLINLGQVMVVDAVAEGLSARQVLERAAGFRPTVVFALVGTQSRHDDLVLLERLKYATGAGLAVSGETVFASDSGDFFPDLAGALVQDFTSPELGEWIDEGCPAGRTIVMDRKQQLAFPRPIHEQFLSRRYQVPFSGKGLVASVLTSFGCPHRCQYCNSGSHNLGFRLREIGRVVEELDWLAGTGRVGHIYFRDMSLTAHRRHCLELCRAMRRRNHGFSFSCYSKPEDLDGELAAALRAAGCRVVQFGIESQDQELLGAWGRSASWDAVTNALAMTRREGMLAGAHLLVGMPGQSDDDVMKTVAAVAELRPHYLSINVWQPRHGAGRSASRPNHDDGASPEHNRQRVGQAYRAFYLNPAYLLRLVGSARSGGELWQLAKLGFNLMRRQSTA